MLRYSSICLSFAVALLVIAGCSTETIIPPSKEAAKKEEEHGHKPSAHGGIIVPIGRDSYHGEAVFEKGGTLRFYTLDRDETRVLEVAAEPVPTFVKAEGDVEAQQILLRPQPQPGDTMGKTSLFLAQLPRDLAGKKVEVTIPSLRIGDDRFRVAFASTADGHGGPFASDPATDEERQLFLTPGGKYTKADIERNGNQTASEKFKGIKANHDLKPAKGEPICPITLTRANPDFTWVVAGKTYQFCCPPCVDEFVRLAKEQPADLKDPEYYRKK